MYEHLNRLMKITQMYSNEWIKITYIHSNTKITDDTTRICNNSRISSQALNVLQACIYQSVEAAIFLNHL